MKVKISQAVRMLAAFLKVKLVPIVSGSPGCGKSDIVRQLAREYNLKVIDLRLSQCDPTDLAGFPTIEGGKADYVPMKHFPIEGDPIPDGYKGWLLFLDEITSAPKAIQAAAYKLVLDHMVGSHHLHPNVAIVAAGNLETDNAIVEPMSTALQSRLVHMELVTDVPEWIDWASCNKVDHRIISFIGFKPSALNNFRPDHTDKTYACPRTWEFANRIMQITEDNSKDRLPMLAGTISEGTAREFLTFIALEKDLPKIKDILTAPTMVKIPDEPSVLFLLTGAIAHVADKDNLGDLMIYIKRLPVEFQTVCLRQLMRRSPELLGSAPIQEWAASSASKLF